MTDLSGSDSPGDSLAGSRTVPAVSAGPDWFHPGELAMQELAGVRHTAERVAAGFQQRIGLTGQVFLENVRCAALAAADSSGHCWATVLVGPKGLLRADETTVTINKPPEAADPIGPLAPGERIGLIAMDFARRRRLRVNGRVTAWSGSRVEIQVDRAYGNCPRHIRPWLIDENLLPPRRRWRTYRELTGRQLELIATAETLFVASSHPQQGADASHRGGPPGFLRALSPRLLVLPDYTGNSMFNTLGNLYVHPRIGLVVPDLRTGRTVQITGRASLTLDPPTTERESGVQRLVNIEVDRVVEASSADEAEQAKEEGVGS